MPCYKPLKGYRSRHLNESGKRSIVFNAKDGFIDMPVDVPCGRCVGCRLEYSRQWALRCMHEAQMHTDNCFITLTYNNENLPGDGSLDVREYQLFMKRLRKKFPDIKIRFYHCGEYGSKNMRPHYHACLFNFDFKDKELWKVKNGIPLYRSRTLEQLWKKGFSTIGEVTFESAAYVARYMMKKQKGKSINEPDEETGLKAYEVMDEETGEITHTLKPEYATMSRRPGVGKDWMEKYGSDIYPSDFITVKGKKMKPPRFYDDIYQHEEPEKFEKIKAKRAKVAKEKREDNDRLRAMEKCKTVQTKSLKRSYEEDDNV